MSGKPATDDGSLLENPASTQHRPPLQNNERSTCGDQGERRKPFEKRESSLLFKL